MALPLVIGNEAQLDKSGQSVSTSEEGKKENLTKFVVTNCFIYTGEQALFVNYISKAQ